MEEGRFGHEKCNSSNETFLDPDRQTLKKEGQRQDDRREVQIEGHGVLGTRLSINLTKNPSHLF